MKLKITLFFLSIILLSCAKRNENDINPGIVGKWKLIQILSDPGDGSGTFQNVNSNKIIQFENNNKLSSNGILCTPSTLSNTSSTGTYNEQELKIYPLECGNNITLNYQINSNELIIDYPCFEACSEKYMKIN